MQTITTKKLIGLLRSTVVPWANSSLEQHFFVASPKVQNLVLPGTVTVTSRQMNGQRTVVKNLRKFGNVRYLLAQWPNDNLQEINFPKIVCITNGTADYLLGDYCAHCPAGTFFLIPPAVPHQRLAPNLQGNRRRNSSCELLHIYAHKHGVHFWYSRSLGERHINEMEDNYYIPSLAAAQTLRTLTDEYSENKSHYMTVASGLIAALFAMIAREIECGNYTRPGIGKAIATPAESASFSDEVHQYLEANCHRQLRLAGVAADLFMSRTQFARRLRQEMDTTFVELLTQYRIQRACSLLQDSNLTFAAIANSLGYHSPTHFQSLFRSHVGCTPMEYRRKINDTKNGTKT